VNQPLHIFDLTPDLLGQAIVGLGMPAFRAKQVLEWVYQHGVVDPDAMTNLSKRDRQALGETIIFTRFDVEQHQQASDGTEKLLLGCEGMQTECVMIPAESRDSGKARRTACISSQVGCPVGCRFCASGLGGLDANLTTGQIVEQVHHLNTLVEPITNIVFMGMGEPLSNFQNVVSAIRITGG
jgi:23S rRNA (adenine2503-C2)-methyltransferase